MPEGKLLKGKRKEEGMEEKGRKEKEKDGDIIPKKRSVKG